MEYYVEAHPKIGDEPFIGISKTLIDYWQWAHSDIVSNSERGKLAEFLVKCAVNSPAALRTEWDAVDIVTPTGVRIEVKSSAYLQAWKCEKLSKIQFDIAPKKSWDSKTNTYYETVGRNSDVYVFCLFSCQDPQIANPMDVSQWKFYILPTAVLNEKIPAQKTIGLSSLLKLGTKEVMFNDIETTIKNILNKINFQY